MYINLAPIVLYTKRCSIPKGPESLGSTHIRKNIKVPKITLIDVIIVRIVIY